MNMLKQYTVDLTHCTHLHIPTLTVIRVFIILIHLLPLLLGITAVIIGKIIYAEFSMSQCYYYITLCRSVWVQPGGLNHPLCQLHIGSTVSAWTAIPSTTAADYHWSCSHSLWCKCLSAPLCYQEAELWCVSSGVVSDKHCVCEWMECVEYSLLCSSVSDMEHGQTFLWWPHHDQYACEHWTHLILHGTLLADCSSGNCVWLLV